MTAFCGTARAATYQFLEDDAEPQFNLQFGIKPAASGNLSVVFDYRDAKNFYALDLNSSTIALRAVRNGTSQRLAQASARVTADSQVVVKRRRWVMEVVIGQRVVLTAYDAALDSGKIGALGSGGWAWQDARMQPVEDIYWTDDFTRLPGENGEWKPGSGRWTLTSSSEESAAAGHSKRTVSERIEMSANPFAYRVAGAQGVSWAQAGRWFWDNYEASVSVKPLARGVIGLAVYAQDAKNYIAFQWSAQEGAGARQLVRVVDGKSTTLASAPGAFLPRQWYRMTVRTSPGFLETFIDGASVFKMRNDWFGQGGIGLVTRDIRLVDFDDAKVTSYDYFRQDFSASPGSASLGSAALGSAWRSQGGRWNATNGVLNSAPSAGENGKTRFLLTGRSDWDGYQVSALARAGAGGACGLVVGYRDDKNYTVFRWAGVSSTLPFKGRQQLMRYQGGKARIVSDEPLSLRADKDGYVPISMRMARGGVVVLVDDALVAQTADESITAGQPALWAQGVATTTFRDVVMAFPPEPQAPKVAPKMADDPLMVGWASRSGEWPPMSADDGVEYWNTGDFFGNATIEYGWRRAAYQGGKLELALRTEREKFNGGYVVRYEDLRDNGTLRVTLLRGATTLKQAEFDWNRIAGADSTKPVLLRVELEGRGILFSIAGKPTMTYVIPGTESVTATGTNFAARASGFRLSARDLRATSEHRDDYTFTEAPTDWYSPQGEWSVISRWPCYADWSFFGGAGLNPVLWTKRTYSGDTVVEYYAHNQMDLPKEPGYSTPGNLNVTIGGDGRNPSSGYSFVVAGWDNTRSRLYKGTQMLAENSSDVARFVKPINHNPTFHNRWYYIRAEVRQARRNGQNGVQLKLTVDDTLICDYFDAEPLPSIQNGGRVAMWTLDSVLMIARAKIESAGMGLRSLPQGLLDAAVPEKPLTPIGVGDGVLVPRPVVTGELASAVVTEAAQGDSEPVFTVRNPAAGGLFAVDLQKGGTASLRATPATRIDMDVTIPVESQVDLYATVNGVRHVISLGKNKRLDARVRVLGEATVTPAAPDGWQHVSFELGAALKRLYPNAGEWKIEDLQIGALHGDDYRWVGFGGNPLGASYKLRGARLVG
ncbi:MAG TPA: hypothetical protein VF600_00185 [Abditibacteriaceae bacterium]|jgi:hypothetical protein